MYWVSSGFSKGVYAVVGTSSYQNLFFVGSYYKPEFGIYSIYRDPTQKRVDFCSSGRSNRTLQSCAPKVGLVFNESSALVWLQRFGFRVQGVAAQPCLSTFRPSRVSSSKHGLGFRIQGLRCL